MHMYSAHREKRIRNLFWTIGEDYTIKSVYDEESLSDLGLSSLEIDHFLLYTAAHDGVLQKFSQIDALTDYIRSRLALGFQKNILIPLTQVAEDIRCESLIAKERPGYENIKKQGISVIVHKLFSLRGNNVEILFQSLTLYANGFTVENNIVKDLYIALQDVRLLTHMPDFFSILDKIYLSFWQDTLSSDNLNILKGSDTACEETSDEDVDWQIDKSDQVLEDMSELVSEEIEQDSGTIIMSDSTGDVDADKMMMATIDDVEDVIDIISDKEIKAMLDVNLSENQLMDKATIEKIKNPKKKSIFEDTQTPEELAQRDRMDYFYGDCYVNHHELMALERELCHGIHDGFKLHMTDGAIRGSIGNEYQEILSTKQKNLNLDAYNRQLSQNKLAIKRLTTTILDALHLASEPEPYEARTGHLIAHKVWVATKTNNHRIFNKSDRSDKGNLVVDILLDASGSQGGRQRTISTQAYMIATALYDCNIPCKVSSYCNFSNYNILRRFRDYHDRASANENIFEYSASGNNRDGLAIRVAASTLLKRSEEHRLLIVLSDGQPADIGSGNPYDKEHGTMDTALQIRHLRKLGISVLGVYTGVRGNLELERFMFGNDFAYINDTALFSDSIGNFMKKYILEMN